MFLSNLEPLRLPIAFTRLGVFKGEGSGPSLGANRSPRNS